MATFSGVLAINITFSTYSLMITMVLTIMFNDKYKVQKQYGLLTTPSRTWIINNTLKNMDY